MTIRALQYSTRTTPADTSHKKIPEDKARRINPLRSALSVHPEQSQIPAAVDRLSATDNLIRTTIHTSKKRLEKSLEAYTLPTNLPIVTAGRSIVIRCQ